MITAWAIAVVYVGISLLIIWPAFRSDGRTRCHWSLIALVVIAYFSPLALLVDSEKLQETVLVVLTISSIGLPLILWLKKPPLPRHLRGKHRSATVLAASAISLILYVPYLAFALLFYETIPLEYRAWFPTSIVVSVLGYVLLTAYLLHADRCQADRREGPEGERATDNQSREHRHR